MAAHPRVAVGETGIDMYRAGSPDVAASSSGRPLPGISIWLSVTGKPLMIHNRQADRDVLDVLRAEWRAGHRDLALLRRTRRWPARVDAGWLLSLSGTQSL